MWSLIYSGNLAVSAVLVVLILMSIMSWAVILIKWMELSFTIRQNRRFQSIYQRDLNLNDLYMGIRKISGSSLARMFESGYRELSHFRDAIEKGSVSASVRTQISENVSRALEYGYGMQTMRLQRKLSVLAIVSSSAPYIGLFGTVLGIIDAFSAISTSGVTSLAIVAPGLSEALIATAVGLLAAIPALIGYNIFRNRLREISAQMQSLSMDIANRFERIL